MKKREDPFKDLAETANLASFAQSLLVLPLIGCLAFLLFCALVALSSWFAA